MPKKSGAENRKLKKKREEETKQLASIWQKWQNKETNAVAGCSSSTTSAEVEKNVNRQDNDDELKLEIEGSRALIHSETTQETSILEEEELMETTKLLNYSDPATWERPYNHAMISALVERGPKQDEAADYSKSVDNEGRQFSIRWFHKIMPNGETVKRDWLMYSREKASLFCFACLLFGKFHDHPPKLADPDCGFSNWKKLNPKIADHETSSEHKNSYIRWKELEKRLKSGQVIDSELEKNIQTEKIKWRNILKAVIHAILYCAENNLALRGSSNDIRSKDCGIFLKTINLIAKHDPEVRCHIEAMKQPGRHISYLSNNIQNEVINLLASEVQQIIVSEISKAKYFSISFDCTPDIAHKEQMTQIIRYVKVTENGKCSIEERFLDFIESKQKTGEGLAQEILDKLQADNIDIKNCRGQCYDNGANMGGQYKGVQARIIQVNEFAYFLPCSAHSLNLVGVHAASVSPKMMTFFGIIQNLFVFFSSSPERWDILMSNLTVSLKKYCDTRWSSKKQAVSAVYKQLPKILKALEDILQIRKNPETYAGAKNFIKQLKNFHFICSLVVWNNILTEIEKVNILLQKKTITVAIASKLIESLKNTMIEIRDDKFPTLQQQSVDLAKSMNIDFTFNEGRKRKVRKQFNYEGSDEGADLDEAERFRITYVEAIDTIIGQLNWRFEELRKVAQDFDFLTGSSLVSMDENTLTKHCMDLVIKYTADLNGLELLNEVLSAKKLFPALDENFEKMGHLEMLQLIHDFDLVANHKNMETAYRIFLSIPVTSASAERSFSKLKLIKNYLRSSMGQERLSSLSLLSIEHDVTQLLDLETIINDFASLKARKVKLN